MASHAIVIGASMAGLLASRTLADHFAQVTVLERDPFPTPGEDRRGVPQGRHLHALMARGREVLEDLFPGLTGDLVARGAPLSDMRARGRWFVRGGYYHRQQAAGGQESLMVSRALLEGTVRERVLGLPNVRAVERCDALGLVADERRGRVTGVRVLRRRAGSAEEEVPADLVVDASGRGSRAPAWLEALGYLPPPEEQVRIGVGYASRYYRRTPTDLGGDHSAVVFAGPGSHRAGVLMAQEGERWHVTLVGYLGEHPPTDEEGFLEFARSLAAPDIYELLKGAEPLSDPLPLRFPASQRRRYEQLARVPDGFLVTGDALCSFNPVYAQGMTVAALEAVALRECLRAGTAGLARRYYRRAGKVVDTPWRTAAGGDLRFPEVEGERTLMVRFVNWYLGRLHVAAHEDPVVAVAFQRVMNMLAPPPSVLQPADRAPSATGQRVAGSTARGRGPAAADGGGPAARAGRGPAGSWPQADPLGRSSPLRATHAPTSAPTHSREQNSHGDRGT